MALSILDLFWLFRCAWWDQGITTPSEAMVQLLMCLLHTLLLWMNAAPGCIHTKGTGLSEHQLKLCDSFVYIPQHGQGTASLNVTVAASIILHHFAVWAGYQECSRHGAKYDVAPPPQRTAARGQVPLSSQEAAALKALRQSSASQDWLMESESGSPSNAADTEQPATGLLGDIFEG
ncbi:hypothetical protein ABBQ38_007053 [Trebouxia sp. C0009 RCD-2024]